MTMKNVPHRWNSSRLRINCSSRLVIVIAAVLPACLNLLADQRASVRDCPPTLLRDTLGYVQNIRSLEYCACNLGKVQPRAPVSAKAPQGGFAPASLFRGHTHQ